MCHAQRPPAPRWVVALIVTSTFLAAMAPSHAIGARWKRFGPEGGAITDLVINPRTPATLYALTASGVSMTRDGGAHWVEPDSFSYVDHIALDADGATVYGASEHGDGVFSSRDGTYLWQTHLIHGTMTAIVADPTRAGLVLAGTDTGSVYRTGDGGQTWRSTGIGAGARVRALVFDATAPDTVYAATAHGVHQSIDGGSTWTDASAGMDDPDVIALASVPGVMYAATPSGTFQSTDGAATWVRTSTSTPGTVRSLAVDPRAPQTLYAGTTSGLYESADAGGTWRELPVGLTVRGVSKVVLDPGAPGVVYCATDGSGIARSTDGGGTWSPANAGLRRHTVSAVAADPRDPATLWASTWSGGVFRSVDGGATFVERNATLSDPMVMDVVVDPSDPDRTWIVTGPTSGIFTSTDAGASWTASIFGVSYLRALVPAPVPGMLYAIDDGVGVIRTTDDGASWTPTAPGPHQPIGLAVGSADGSLVYAGTQNGLYRSADGGASWTVKLPDARVTAVALAPLHPATVYAGTWEPDGTIYRSTDGGETWHMLRAFQDVGAIAVDPRDANVVFVANGWGVAGSVDGGNTWDMVGDNTVALNGLQGLSIPRPGLLCAGAWSGGAFMIEYGPPEDPAPPGPPRCLPVSERVRRALARGRRTTKLACPAPSLHAVWLAARARRDLATLRRERRRQAPVCADPLRRTIAPLRRWIARCNVELPVASRRP